MNRSFYNHSWCTVDIRQAENNIRFFKEHYASDCKLMCVVKANAYGHGAKEICPAFERGGADWFAVSALQEAVELRKSGSRLPVLILGYTSPEDASVLYQYQITQTIHSLEYARELSASLQEGERLPVHIKADTGMGRIGFDCVNRKIEELCGEIRQVKALSNLDAEGIFTHFSVADEFSEDCVSYSDQQALRFKELVEALKKQGILFQLKHCSNSAALLYKPGLQFDMVRLGIAAYGLSPNGAEYAGMEGAKPLMEMKTMISQVKEIQAGTGISYGKTFVAQKPMRVATLCVGYADGFRRSPDASRYVLIHGQTAPLLGRVCMDQCIADVSHIPDVKMGDEAVLFGRSGDAFLSVDEVADMWGTINYEVICGISERVKRVYLR